jgi:hypothetical protein
MHNSIKEQLIDIAFTQIDDLLMELIEQHKRLLEVGKLTFAQGDWGDWGDYEQEERELWRLEHKIESLGYSGHRDWNFAT